MLRDKIRELASILRSEGLEEIEIRSFWRSVRVRRPGSFPEVSTGQIAKNNEDKGAGDQAGPEAGSHIEPQVTVADEGRSQVQAENLVGQDGEKSSQRQILSPMVGTFYSSANPESEPYVQVGSNIAIGQVICIIEAMKLMNEIEAESECVIREILVEDSHPVEFGQPLFLVDSA